ncbi:Phosphatidylinositol-4-phosphate 5-kinase [Coemansia sp. RSA 1358]|nr:Phosphatidylinositol-4-phosphate 5-kinase [Coemansia sp. RSA 1358]
MQTIPSSGAHHHSQQQQQQPHPYHSDLAGAIIAPPTPVSASASASASSTSYSSRAQDQPHSVDSASNRSSSSKSTIALVSLPSDSADNRPSFDNEFSGHSHQFRAYDKHQTLDVQELPMEPVQLPAHHISNTAALGHYRHDGHKRQSSSHSQQPYGAESEGRSGSVPVSSLLPGARTSPLSTSRRVPGQASLASNTPSPGIRTSASAEMATQQYLVQRIPTRPSPEIEQQRISGYASFSASQIRLASPRARLYEQQQRSLSPGPDTLEGLSAYSARATADGGTPAYFADSEMDGNSFAALNNKFTPNGSANGGDCDDDDNDDAIYNAARNSWNVSSDDGISCRNDKSGRLKQTERQRKRQAVLPTSVTTEKYHVRPVSILQSNQIVPDRGSPALAVPMESPVDVAYVTNSPYSASASMKSIRNGLSELNDTYAASSADERPAWSEDMHSHFNAHARGKSHASRMMQSGGGRGLHPFGLDHRATSFDLGRIGRLSEVPADRFSGAQSLPRVRISDNADRNGSNRSGLGTAILHSSTRSSERLASLSRAGSYQQPGEKLEDGYDGDSEGILTTKLLPPVQRRNTVAGDKIDDAPSFRQRAAGLKMARNTSDFSGLAYNKDERRPMRNSRRRSTAQNILPIGTQIAPGHANYVLMYNMLTGIRVSVSRCEAKDPRPVRADDYIAAHKYSFDVVGDEMTPSSRYDFKFKDYAPWVFRCIREAFHLSTEDYLVSLTDKYILSEVGSSGKSGSFFYYSQDYRFIIKTVHHTEHKFMREILPQYYEFVRDHPNTLLSRIYGLHRIKLPQGRKVHFIVMSNILPPNKDIHAQFDLKGSLLGRELSPELASKPRACMKDKNWIKMHQRLHLGPSKRHEFVKQLIKDVALLIRLNIMDYSLLIGIHDLNKGNVAKLRDTTLAMFDPQTITVQQQNRMTRAHTIRKKVVHTDPVALDALPRGTVPPLPESMFQELRYSIFYREDGGILSSDRDDNPGPLIYYLGVIDILTPYNMIKRTEHLVKSVVHDGSQISAVNPRKYGLRFLRFMIRSLDGCEDVLPLLEEFERTTYQEICREHRFF